MATPGQQAARALRTGGVRQLADTQPQLDEGIQNANALKIILQQAAKAAPGKAKEALKADEAAKQAEALAKQKQEQARVKAEGGDPTTVPAPDPIAAGRVAEPITEGIAPEGTTRQATQEALAKDALSPEGQQRLAASGGDARVAIAQPTQRELAEQPDLFGPADPEPLSNEQVTRKAQLAQSPLDTVARSETAIADAGDADDLIRIATEPGLVDETGIDFNFDNFEGGEDINRVINGVSQIFESATEAEKRGVQTNPQTLADADKLLADEIGFSRKLLRKKSGQLLNAAEMTAARILMQKSGQRLTEMARQIQSGLGSPKLLVDFRRQMSIHAGIQMKAKGAQTEIARALQAFKIPAGTEVPGEAIEALLTESGGPNLAKKMADGYLEALEKGGQANANKYVSGAWYQKVPDVWLEVYMNGLLSYFPTHIKNGLGTPLFMVYNTLVDLGAAGIGGAIRTGQRAVGANVDTEGVFAEDVFMRLYGYTKSFGDALSVAKQTYKDEVPADALNKMEAAQLRAIDRENLNITNNTLGLAVDHLGRIIRLPGRALMFADDFFKVIASRGTLYEETMRQVRRSKSMGRTEQEALDDGMMVLLDPSFAAKEMDTESRYATMTSDLGDTAIGTGTAAIRRSFLGKLLVPFAKAPTNSMLRVAEGHPLFVPLQLMAKNSRDTLLGKNGARAQQRAYGRLALGGSTMLYFHSLAVDGRLTGSYPKERQLQKMLPPGWQPYSFVFRGEGFPVDEDGDPLPLYNKETGRPNGPLNYVSYQGIEPVSAFLGIAASTARHQHMFVEPEDAMNWGSAATYATYEYFRDLPMLQGVGSIARAMEHGDPSIITDGFLGGTTTVFPMPFSSAVRNIDKLTQSDKRTVDKPYDYYTIDDVRALAKEKPDLYPETPYHFVGTVKRSEDIPWAKHFHDNYLYMWETQIMNTPYVNQQVENFAYQYDMLGFKKERSPRFDINPVDAIWSNVTPFKVSRGADIEPYHAELIRLGAPLTESRDKKSIDGVKIDAQTRGELTDIAKNQIALPLMMNVRGRKRQVGPAQYRFRDYLKVLMSRAEYTKASDDDRINMIKNAEARFYRVAIDALSAKPGYQYLRKAKAAQNSPELQQIRDQRRRR